MAEPTNFGRWAASGDNVVEPDEGLQESGHIPQPQHPSLRPKAQHYNWIHNSNWVGALYLNNRLKKESLTYLRSDGTASWNSGTGTLALSENLDIVFRDQQGERINRLTAGNYVLADGQYLLFRKNFVDNPPVVLAEGDYGVGLSAGQYAIVNNAALSSNLQEHEFFLFRRRGTQLEICPSGIIIDDGETFKFGKPGENADVDLAPYVKRDGTTSFTGVQTGVTPDGATSTHLATVEYVDDTVSEVMTDHLTDYDHDDFLAASEDETISGLWTFSNAGGVILEQIKSTEVDAADTNIIDMNVGDAEITGALSSGIELQARTDGESTTKIGCYIDSTGIGRAGAVCDFFYIVQHGFNSFVNHSGFLFDPNDPTLNIYKRADGDLIEFFNSNVSSGSISQAGGVVSYNAFLSGHHSQSDDKTKLERGDLVIFSGKTIEHDKPDPNDFRHGKTVKSSQPHDPRVYAIFSHVKDNGDIHVFGNGAGFAKVCTENGPIKCGDLLTSSSTPGVCMRQDDNIYRACTVGKAVVDYDKDGIEIIAVVLQCGG
jgi:hypothetical protein